MLAPDDIRVYAPDIEIADRVLARVENGVPRGREMHADEVLPVLQALRIWKGAAMAAMDYAKGKGADAMRMEGE